ncbi:MAG TPA: type III-B CRISPR module RAMP protein Cmr4 [Streptosporangiaceae bacterium]
MQREAATGYPVIWGQSVKGALRQAAEEQAHHDRASGYRPGGVDDSWTPDRVRLVFGSEVGDNARGDGSTTPGQLNIGDAQLVALPVPTLRRTFAWATSAVALGRLARKYRALHRRAPKAPAVRGEEASALAADWRELDREVIGPCVVPVSRERDENPETWADSLARDAVGAEDAFAPFASKLREDLILVGDAIMPTLVRECLEQAVRVQLNDAKTVENGPFYSEYLPAETILAAALTLRDPADSPEIRAALARLLDGKLHQIGGDETLGKGLVWCRLLEPEAAQ